MSILSENRAIEDVIDATDFVDYYDDSQYRLPKIYIKDAQNAFELPLEKFKKRFRFYQVFFFSTGEKLCFLLSIFYFIVSKAM